MKATFAFAVFIVSYLLVSHNQYAVEKAIADEKKAAEPAKPQSRMEPAPIFSKRCMRRGQVYNATQADGGNWIIHCYGPRGTRT